MESALGDSKLAKSLHAACRSHGKTAKRAAEASTSPEVKKPRLELHKRNLDYDSMTANKLEASLGLPLVEDEAIRATTIVTNRTPLVLAFAVELLRFTMPEQPPSSRLSLAQAVVSANSRAKAVSLVIEKAPAGSGEQIPRANPGSASWDATCPSSSAAATHGHPRQPCGETRKPGWRAHHERRRNKDKGRGGRARG